jgi:D-beta-D-heptose 7-phosphate kinase/D-beta-D-heptose 1-phosphate adenosyltransferase
VTLVSATGDDLEAGLLRDALAERGVETGCIVSCAERGTLAKHRLMASSQLLARFDTGSTAPLDDDCELTLINQLRAQYATHDAVVVSDYGYGVITPNVIRALAELQTRQRRVIVVDSRDLPRFRHIRPAAVKPNYDEAVALLRLQHMEGADARGAQIEQHATRLLDITGAHIVAVTLDTDGALVIERGAPPYRTYARPAPNSKAAGAGDTFVSAMAVALGMGADMPAAAEVASAAASVSVEKDGTNASPFGSRRCALKESASCLRTAALTSSIAVM